jgi:Ser/Thr protein kinase RdoA (MazF antagonist)
VRAQSETVAPLPFVTAHGDYTHSQVLFDGTSTALVDFDTMCRSEPALDLGHFCAHLRVACRKAEAMASSSVTDDFCERFLGGYAQAYNGAAPDLEALHARVNLYEAASLLRIAIHSWCQFKAARTATAVSVLGERMACLPTLTT